jgi:hypothetical protein
MAPPIVSGINVLGAFNTSGTRTGTTSRDGGAVNANILGQNSEYIEKKGIDGGLCHNLFTEFGYLQWVAVRFTMTQLGATNPSNFSNSLFVIHFQIDLYAGSGGLSVMDPRSLGGMTLRIYSDSGATIYRDYPIYGGDTDFITSAAAKRNTEGWQSAVIDLNQAILATTTVGSFNPATIYAIEFRYFQANTTAGITAYHDRFCSTSGLILTAGDSSTPGSFRTLSNYSENTQRTFLLPSLGSSFYSKIPLFFGNGSTASRFEVVDQNLIFAGSDGISANPQHSIVLPNYLGLTINLSANCYWRSIRTSYSSSSKWKLVIIGSPSANFIWFGGVISNLGADQLEGPSNFNGVIFSNCDCLNSSSNRGFANCTITAGTDIAGAFNWDGSQDINRASFTDNVTPAGAIKIVLSGDLTVYTDENIFSGNTNDWVITGTGTLTIIRDALTTTDKNWANTAGGTTANGINASGLTGNVIVLAPQPTLIFTDILAGSELTIRLSGVSTVIYKVSSTGTTESYSYPYPGYDQKVDILINKEGYQPYRNRSFLLRSVDQFISVEQPESTAWRSEV